MYKAVRWAIAIAAVVLPARPVSGQSSDTVVPSGTPKRTASAHVVPGDRIWVKVWREPLLSDTVWVDERGDVLLPKIGKVDVASLPIADIPDSLRARFGQYLRDAPVEIVVLRRVIVNGGVARPGVYYVDGTTSLRDLVARAGGVTDIGNEGNVVVVRGSQQRRVKNWQSDASQASDLQSGDEVIVGKKSWFEQNVLAIVSVSTVVASLLISLHPHL